MAADAPTTLASGSVDLVPQGGLEERLDRGSPLRVKLGVDPSRPDLTLGHAVVLRKLKQFQAAGHVAVLIIGDFTARIGDPSGQSETRPMLTKKEIRANADTYLAQAEKVVDIDSAEIHMNSEWSSRMTMPRLLKLASTATVAQMLEREDFRERYEGKRPISVVEFLYPLFQGHDSVAVRADVEIGGTDQKFNLLMGREVQRAYGQEPQVVLTVPLLEGTDGVRKMSKSLDNYIGLTEPADDMFGKLYSIPDDLIVKYLRLATDLPPPEVESIEEGLKSGRLNPSWAKRKMARLIVDLYHGPEAGKEAEARYNRRFRLRAIPVDEVESKWVQQSRVLVDNQVDVGALLHALDLARSRSEGRRQVDQEAVRCRWTGWQDEQGEKIVTPRLPWRLQPPLAWEGSVWSVGKRKFARLKGFKSS